MLCIFLVGIQLVVISNLVIFSELKGFISALGAPSHKTKACINVSVSKVTFSGIYPGYQIVEVNLRSNLLSQGLHVNQGGSTIKLLLKAQPAR